MPAACSSYGHLMNVLDRPPSCGCSKSECDGLTSGLVVSTTAQDRNVTKHHTVEQVPGDCVDTKEASKAHHPNKSSGPGHGCPLSEQHPDHNQPIANDGQYEGELSQEDRVEGISPRHTMEISLHEITETLNDLVSEGSSIGSCYTLDLIAPPKLTSEIISYPR